MELVVQTGTPGSRFYSQQTIDESGTTGESEVLEFSVVRECSTPDGCQKVEAAAKYLVVAILRTVTALEKADPNAKVTVLGRQISVATLLSTIMETKYTVTERDTFDNGGGGEANAANMTDVISYKTIGLPPQVGPGGMSAPTGWHVFSNNNNDTGLGIVALVLHEAAHMTQVGFDFYKLSYETARSDPKVTGEFYSGDAFSKRYERNVEAFVNQIAKDTSILMQDAIPGWFNNGADGPPEEPNAIRARNASGPQ